MQTKLLGSEHDSLGWSNTYLDIEKCQTYSVVELYRDRIILYLSKCLEMAGNLLLTYVMLLQAIFYYTAIATMGRMLWVLFLSYFYVYKLSKVHILCLIRFKHRKPFWRKVFVLASTLLIERLNFSFQVFLAYIFVR